MACLSKSREGVMKKKIDFLPALVHYFHYVSLAKLNILTLVLAEALTNTMGDMKGVNRQQLLDN